MTDKPNNNQKISFDDSLPTVDELLATLMLVPEDDKDLKVSINCHENLKPHLVKMGFRIIGVRTGCYLVIGGYQQ